MTAQRDHNISCHDYYNQVWRWVTKIGADHSDGCNCFDCVLRQELKIAFDQYDSKLQTNENGKKIVPIGVRLGVHLWIAEKKAQKRYLKSEEDDD